MFAPPLFCRVSLPAVPVKSAGAVAPGQRGVLSRAQMLGVMPLSPVMVPFRKPDINVLCN